MDNENTVVSSGKKSKLVPIVILVLIVLAVVGYMVFGKGKTLNVLGQNPSVATVNGVAIPKSDYDAQMTTAVASYKAQGVDLATATSTLDQVKTQIMDNLISNELLAQGVTVAKIKADPAEVEKQYQAILTQSGGAEGLKTALAKNNLTDVQLRANITKQLAIQTYLLQNIDVKSITVTDAEIAQFYSDYSKQQKAADAKAVVPALKDLSAQIKQQITTNKENVLVTDFIAGLKAKATIVTNI